MNFEYRLLPCQLSPQPTLRGLPDLTQNVEVAQAIVDRIEAFFKFPDAWPTFSGYARRADRNDGRNPLLYVQMTDEGKPYRSFAFRDTGFVGVLYVEDRTGKVPHFSDYLYAIACGFMDEGPVIASDWEETCLGLVEGDQLHVSLPFRP